MTFKFEIPGRLPGMNEIIGAARYNRFAGAKQKKNTTTFCEFWIVAHHIPPIDVPVTLHFAWYEPNMRRDVGNIRSGEKFISDALVKCKVLKNDTQLWVRGMSDEFHCDAKYPRVEVTITPIQ